MCVRWGRIAASDLLVLEDPRHAIPPYDAILLVTGKRAHDALLREALSPLIDAIPIERMREANMLVDRNEHKLSPAEAASWLAQEAQLH